MPRQVPQRYSTPFLLLLCIVLAMAGAGCAAARALVSASRAGEIGDTSGRQAGTAYTVGAAELDELTRAFADRYVGLLSSTCDALKKDNFDPVQRREAQELMLNCATNVYDIASNADAFTRMLDLVVVSTLLSQVWVDDDRAGDTFGSRGEVLVRALHHGRVEAWALAARVLRPEQLDVLDYTIWDWRRQNPDMKRASFVRFSNFALDRGKSANAEVLAAGGFFKDIGRQGQAVDEARLLTERMFYRLKREPTLMRWQAEAAKDEVLATPEVGKALADITKVAERLSQLPLDVAAERQAIFLALDERLKDADGTLSRLGEAIADSRDLSDSVGKTSGSLGETLRTADALFSRFDAWDRWSTELPKHRSFDVREYTQGLHELAAAAANINDSLRASEALLASPGWGDRIDEVNRSADGRMILATDQGERLVNAAFVRLVVGMVLFFLMLVAYRAASLLLTRRLVFVPGAGPPSGNGPGEVTTGMDLPRAAGGGIRLRHILWAIAIIAGLYILTSCTARPAPGERLSDDDAEVERTAAAVVADELASYVPVSGLTGTITSVGASTTTNLVARAVTEFRQIYPGVTLQFTAGLTSTGPPALLAGLADVVPMSRPLQNDEIERFRAEHGYPPTEIKVAADALAIYVEKRNPVEGLTLTQLDGIFSRTRLRGAEAIETWGDVGLTGDWADRPIPLYGYGPTDGIHQVFRHQVLAGGEYRLSLQVVPAGSLIVQDVAADPSAIGCASIFFASKRTRAVPIAGADGVFYAPTDDNVRTLRYPLTRFITICVNKAPGRPLPPATREFLRFLLSAEGQQIVAAGGNVRIDPATAVRGLEAIQ